MFRRGESIRWCVCRSSLETWLEENWRSTTPLSIGKQLVGYHSCLCMRAKGLKGVSNSGSMLSDTCEKLPNTAHRKNSRCLCSASTVWHEIYWRELYLADSLFLLFPQDWQIFIWRTDLEWTLTHKHMHAYASLAEFKLAVLSYIRQSAKLNSPPIFHAIRYVTCIVRTRKVFI